MRKLPTITLFERQQTESVEMVTPFFAKATATKAIVKDAATFDQFIFEGDHFKYSGGVIDSGTIEKLTFANENGQRLMVLSHLHLNAGTLAGDTVADYVLSLLRNVLSQSLEYIGTNVEDGIPGTAGNDRLFGRGGNDTLNGEEGNDRLVGGAGKDVFIFDEGFGKDVIVDFDAVGGDDQQDVIDADFSGEISIHRSGRNAIIDFGGGDTLTLLGVKPSQIDIFDFV